MTVTAATAGCTLWYPHKASALLSPLQGVLPEEKLRNLIAMEDDNQRAVEDVINNTACSSSCSCFLEHKTVALEVVLNTYTPVTSWDSTFTCGTRPTSDTATTILLCNWRVNISDYSDGATSPFPNTRFGYGVFATENDNWIAGSHGFIDWVPGSDGAWVSNIADLPAGVEWPDALTSGSFAVPINVVHTGVDTSFDIAAVLGIWNPGIASASFDIDTYEYALCGCECQE